MREENPLGAHPYFYFVKHKPDLNEACGAASAGISGRPVQSGDSLSELPDWPELAFTRMQHASIEEAFDDADADGTRSILDLDQISDEPEFGAVTPVPDES